jgi:hypothetical protein
LVEWIAEHRITSDTLLQVIGEDTWQTAQKWVPELFPDSPETRSPAAPPVRTAPVAADAVPPHLTEDPIARDATRGSVAAAKAALLQKRRRQQIRNWVILGLLLAIVLTLGATLVVLLWR